MLPSTDISLSWLPRVMGKRQSNGKAGFEQPAARRRSPTIVVGSWVAPAMQRVRMDGAANSGKERR
jgi:hypothetical protein